MSEVKTSLTAQDLALYIGQQVRITGAKRKRKSTLTGVLLMGDSLCVQIRYRNGFRMHLASDTALLLRPLSSLTEEEQQTLVRLHWHEKAVQDFVSVTPKPVECIEEVGHYSFRYEVVYKNKGVEPERNVIATIAFNRLTPEQLRYLLSIGIDLFYWIPAGLAIDKTKLEK